MRIILEDKTIIDSINDSIVIVFDNDEERKTVASHLTNMPEADHVRVYAIYNHQLISETKLISGMKLIDDSLKLLGYERGIDSFS